MFVVVLIVVTTVTFCPLTMFVVVLVVVAGEVVTGGVVTGGVVVRGRQRRRTRRPGTHPGQPDLVVLHDADVGLIMWVFISLPPCRWLIQSLLRPARVGLRAAGQGYLALIVVP